MNQQAVGKLFRLVGSAATIGLAACVHAAAEQMPLGQIMAFRAAISGVIILLYALAINQRAALWPQHWRPHLMRGGLACIAMYLTYVAFARLPVTQAQTLTYLAPLIVLPLAIWRLKEPFSIWILLSLGLGFCGVLMILGLSIAAGSQIIWGAIAGIGGAIIIAIIQIKVRAMTATETALSISFSFTIIVTGVTIFTALLGNWVWPTGPLLWVVLGSGLFGALNIVCFAEALARAPASVIAPLDYTGLLWALLVDWIIFSHIPGAMGILGSVLITVAALIVALKPNTR